MGWRRVGLWAAVGTASGALVLGTLAPVLFLLDNRVQGYPSGSDELYVAVVASAIAGVWGAAGGLASGLVCAGVTYVRERRVEISERTYGRTAAAVTATLAAPVGALQLMDGGSTAPAWDLFVWVVAPVITSAAVARLLGRWMWRRTQLVPSS